MSCAWWWMERGLRRQDVNAAGDTRHGRCGTARSSMMSYGDQEELEHVSNGVCDELAWCIQAGTRDTESTGCVIGQARQPVDRCACECYGRCGVWCISVRHAGRIVCKMIRARYVLPMAWSHGFCQWRVAYHGIWIVSCSMCLETERSSGRPIDTINRCYETWFRWWCGSGVLWQ